MIKKIISVFIIFSLSALNLIGYIYDNLSISYDSNSTAIYTKIVKLSPEDHKTINTLNKNYNFSDGSSTNLYVKWLKITKSKLDFKTNNKWILINSSNILSNENIENDLAPKKVYVLTSNISKFKNLKEKYLNHTSLISMIYNHMKITETDNYQIILSKNTTLLNSVRWPPEFYISNPDIKC